MRFELSDEPIVRLLRWVTVGMITVGAALGLLILFVF